MHKYEQRKDTVYRMICDPDYIPMKIKEIAIIMQVSKEDRPMLDQILLELQDEGKIELTKRGKYVKSEKKNELEFILPMQEVLVL